LRVFGKAAGAAFNLVARFALATTGLIVLAPITAANHPLKLSKRALSSFCMTRRRQISHLFAAALPNQNHRAKDEFDVQK